MSAQPYELVDHACPQAVEILRTVEAEVTASGLVGEQHFAAVLATINERAAEHKTSCERCRAFAVESARPPFRGSAVWGGGTLGLIVGLLVGIVTENYWQTVLLAVLTGALLGVGANVLASLAERLTR